MTYKTKALQELNSLYQKDKKNSLADYCEFLKFASISSEPKFKQDLEACAKWLFAYLQKLGMHAEYWETKGHPVLYAERLDAGKDKPTILFYTHYDVQPVDPIEEWHNPPFTPTEKEGQIYARGAQDNKGQCWYLLQAIKILLERDQKLPVNVKLVVEGEEECGSESLPEISDENKKKLKADYLTVVDVGMYGPGVPAITLGVRGIITAELEVIGSNTDMHSGFNGGIVYNPIHALVEMIAKLRSPDGKITIPGFYDEVRQLSMEERSKIDFDFDNEQFEKTFEAKLTGGETGFSPLERTGIRPTLEINGIAGGYYKEGFKTVIPCKAIAKISCRLVPDMDPAKIFQLLKTHLESNVPGGLTAKLHSIHGGGPAVRAKADSKAVKAFAQAYEETFDKPCKFIMEGGSIPVITALAKIAQADVLFIGLGLATDKIHAPNEHFSLDRLEQGAVSAARAMELLAQK